MCSHKNSALDLVLSKLARLNMNSTYIKYLVKRLRNAFAGQGKTPFLKFIDNWRHSRPKSEAPAGKGNLGSGPRILTTDEVNESRLLDSPLSDNSVHLEKTFSSEQELVIEQGIRKFVLEWSKVVFRDWFKTKTVENQLPKARATAPSKLKRKRGRRLKKMGDL